MTKSDLKTGMIVTLRDGEEYVFIKDFVVGNNYCIGFSKDGAFINTQKKSWVSLDAYKDNLITNEIYNKHFDIMKIEMANHVYSIVDTSYDKDSRRLIYEREEPKQMTVAEIEAILGYKVEIVSEVK